MGGREACFFLQSQLHTPFILFLQGVGEGGEGFDPDVKKNFFVGKARRGGLRGSVGVLILKC